MHAAAKQPCILKHSRVIQQLLLVHVKPWTDGRPLNIEGDHVLRRCLPWQHKAAKQQPVKISGLLTHMRECSLGDQTYANMCLQMLYLGLTWCSEDCLRLTREHAPFCYECKQGSHCNCDSSLLTVQLQYVCLLCCLLCACNLIIWILQYTADFSIDSPKLSLQNIMLRGAHNSSCPMQQERGGEGDALLQHGRRRLRQVLPNFPKQAQGHLHRIICNRSSIVMSNVAISCKAG